MTKRRIHALCRGCGTTFEKRASRDYYCGIECAIFSRIAVAGPDDCWLWKAAANDQGYGQLVLSGRKVYAHRAAYEMRLGHIGDRHLCHRCDTPLCCNPAHMFPGTQGDNMRDMHLKGRWIANPRRGERAPQTKLTERDVLDIRAALARGEQLRPMARRYGVSQGCLQEIRRGDSWKHLL